MSKSKKKLQERFIDYQLLSVPRHVWNDATVKTDEDGVPCLFQMNVIIVIWEHLNPTTLIVHVDDLLARVALTVLCLPH